VASDAQPETEAAVEAEPDAPRAAGVGSAAVARPLVASVEPAETAAVNLWTRGAMVWAAALEPALVSAAKEQTAADPQSAAYR
jgi:hypothetical protein